MKLILAVGFTAFGIWLAFNYPNEAKMLLEHVIIGWNYAIEFLGQYV